LFGEETCIFVFHKLNTISYKPNQFCFAASSINMSSAGRDANYYIKRQKNNEAARVSRMKRKEKEMQTEKEKKQLEATYVQLRKELLQIHKKKIET